MKALDDLKELLEDQIKRVTKKGDITPNELESMYKAVDIIKDISTIHAMEKAEKEEEEYTKNGAYSRRSGGSSYGMHGDMSVSNGYFPHYPMYSYATPNWNSPQQQPNSGGEMMNGNTQNYGMSNDGRRGRDADNDGRYSEESSYRRSRDAMGRFTSRDGGSYENSNRYYSRQHSTKEKMLAKLEDMVDDAKTSRERETIMKVMDKLEE